MLNYDRAGNMWPLGALKKTLETDFNEGTLPSWLTMGTNSTDTATTVILSPSQPGGVRFKSGTDATSTITVMGPAFNLNQVIGARLQVSFTGGATTGAQWALGFIGDTVGGYAEQGLASSSKTFLRAVKDTAVTQQETGWEASASAKRYHASLIITPEDGGLYLGEGDHVWTHREFESDMGLGVVRPMIRWTGANLTRDIHQFKFDREWL